MRVYYDTIEFCYGAFAVLGSTMDYYGFIKSYYYAKSAIKYIMNYDL